jgi:hypothetical protein
MAVVSEPPTGAQFELHRGRERLVVDAIGAAVRSWTVGGQVPTAGTLAGPGQLTFSMEDRFRFVQVFTADAAIAVEPMSCAPDAFNSGEGLVVPRRLLHQPLRVDRGRLLIAMAMALIHPPQEES